MVEARKIPRTVINTPLRLLGNEIRIETTFDMRGINVIDRLKNPEHYSGPKFFPDVVRFGSFFVDREMRGTKVPDGDQWSSENLPPKGITIMEFLHPNIKARIDEISSIASEDFYHDIQKTQRYADLNAVVMRALAAEAKLYDDEDNETVYMGLIRAGVVAGEMLGIFINEQVLVQTKRLVEKKTGDSEDGDISIGIKVENPEKLREIHGKTLVIADPAGATFASIVANVFNLVDKGILPKEIVIFNTVASHKGAEFALEAISNLGIEVRIYAGGYAPEMNEDYYLVSKEGNPSVRDAGNALNRFLPSDFQLRF